MSENIDLNLNLDSSGFVQGATQASGAAGALANAFQGTERQAGAVGKALSLITPGRLFTAASVTAAGAYQQELSGMSATAAVTGQNMGKLQQGMASLARSMPIGNRGAVEITSTLQSMGYASKTQIGTIKELGKAYAELGHATGQNAAMIGRQMTTLSRAFGASDSDAKRFSKMSDSLTTVTAKIGGSSSDILQFSKSIAPMARSAGIGQTAVMGISAAFSKMGEDGYGAATAMNKMLTDLNRSVRDGSGEMGTYANIVGKTRGEFEALFKNDPTKALGMLTKSLGSGPGAERNLERIGLDGVRTSRVFQALGQQGGIENAANTAVAGYGDGSTKRAAKASEGLFDEFTKLRSSVEQVTEALGRPFLGALTKVVQVTGAPVRGVAGVLQNPITQKAIQIGAPVLAGLLGLRALGALGNSSSFARQLLVNNQGTQAFRNARNAVNTGASAVPGQPYNRFGQFAYGMGSSYQGNRNTFREASQANIRDRLIARGMPVMLADQQARIPGPSPLQRVMGAPRAAMNAAAVGRGAYNAMMTDSARQMRTADATMRSGSVLKTAGLDGLATKIKTIQSSSLPAAQKLALMTAEMKSFGATTNAETKAIGAATKILRSELSTTATGLRALAAQAGATGRYLLGGARGTGPGAGARTGGMLAGAGALGMKGLGAVGAMMNPAMLAMVGGMATVSYMRGEVGKNKQQNKDWAEASVTGTTDAYRNAMGRATDATQTFAEQVMSANKAMMKSATTDSQGRTLTAQDEQYAEDTKDKIVRHYKGSAREVAGRINTASAGKLDPQDLKAVAVDLRRQFSKETTDQIMAMVGGTEGKNAAGDAVKTNDYARAFRSVASDQSGASVKKSLFRNLMGQEGDTGGGWKDALGSITSRPGKAITGIMSLGGLRSTGAEVGGKYNSAAITRGQEEAIASAREGIGTTFDKSRDSYGDPYAKQERGQSINEAFSAAIKSGNKDFIAAASKAFTTQLGGRDQAANITSDEAKKHGGLVQAYMAENKWAKENLKGIELDPSKQGVEKKLTDSALTKAVDGVDLFATTMSNRVGDIDGAANKATKAYLETPGNMRKFRDAIDATTTAGRDAGMSLTQVGDAALKTVNKLNDATSDASKLARAVFEESYNQNEANAGFQGSRVTTGNRMRLNASLIANAGDTEAGHADYARGKAGLQGDVEGVRQRMAARLQVQFDYQKQTDRAQEDFNKSNEYAQLDYHKGLMRQEEDYGIGRVRATRDFNIQVGQAMEDFQTSRQRANRDFNKQLARQNEDAAKAMYQPFQRIQTQQVTDMGTLMVNLGEQNAAMEAQKKNLDDLRKAGLTNQAIDQLGLGKSENAQQTQRIMEDVQGGMGTGDLNKIVSQRMRDAAALAGDSSNVDRKRSKEDFAQSMTDNSADFQKGVKRNRAAFAKSMADQAADYARNLARQLHDFMQGLARQQEAFDKQKTRQIVDIADSTKEILGNFETLAAATQDALSGKAVDFRTLMKTTLEGTITDAASLVEKYPGFFQGVMAEAAAAPAHGGISKANSADGPGGDGVGMGYKAQMATIHDAFPSEKVTSTVRPGAVTASGNVSYHSMGRAIDMAPTWPVFNWLAKNYPNSTELIYTPAGDRQLKNGKSHIYGPEVAKGHYDHIHWAMRNGGIATKPTRALIAEAGHNEAVIPLNNEGVAKLAAAMTQYITGPDAQRMLGKQHGDRVTYTGNTFIQDHSTQVTGPITVQAQDPNAMMRQLQAKARNANLTATPTRKAS